MNISIDWALRNPSLIDPFEPGESEAKQVLFADSALIVWVRLFSEVLNRETQQGLCQLDFFIQFTFSEDHNPLSLW